MRVGINKAWRNIPTLYIDARHIIRHRKRTVCSDSTNTVINNQDILIAFYRIHGEGRLARHTDHIGVLYEQRAFGLIPGSPDIHFDRCDCGMRVLSSERHVITLFVIIDISVVIHISVFRTRIVNRRQRS